MLHVHLHCRICTASLSTLGEVGEVVKDQRQSFAGGPNTLSCESYRGQKVSKSYGGSPQQTVLVSSRLRPVALKYNLDLL